MPRDAFGAHEEERIDFASGGALQKSALAAVIRRKRNLMLTKSPIV